MNTAFKMTISYLDANVQSVKAKDYIPFVLS